MLHQVMLYCRLDSMKEDFAELKVEMDKRMARGKEVSHAIDEMQAAVLHAHRK